MNDTAANCKEKWRNIRTVFTRKLKISISGFGRQKKYYLMDYLQFLVPFLGNKSSVSGNVPSPGKPINYRMSCLNNSSNGSSNNPSEQGDLEVPGTPFKRPKQETNRVDVAFVKYVEEKRRQPKEENPRRMFLLSLLPDVQKLSEQNMRKFRRQVLEVLGSLLDDTPIPTSDVQHNGPPTPYQPYGTHVYTSTPSDRGNSLADYYQNFSSPENLSNL